MDLIIFGSFIFLIFSISQLMTHFLNTFGEKIESWKAHPKTTNIVDILKSQIPLAILAFQSREGLLISLRKSQDRSWSSRQILFNLAIHPLGSTLWLLLICLLGRLNGVFLLGISSILYLLGILLFKRSSNSLAEDSSAHSPSLTIDWILSFPIVLIAGEIFQNKLGMIFNESTGPQEVWLWLSDGHPSVLLASFILGIILSFPSAILPQRGIFSTVCSSISLLFICSILVTMHLVHPLVAIQIYWGSRIGEIILLFWKKRMETKAFPWFREFLILQCLGFVLLFLLEGYAKDWFIFTNPQVEFLSFLTLALVTQFILQMIWGHFRVLKIQD